MIVSDLSLSLCVCLAFFTNKRITVLQLLLSLLVFNWQLSRRKDKKKVLSNLHPYAFYTWKKKSREKKERSNLKCLLHMSIDKHFSFLFPLYAIIFCQIRTSFSNVIVTDNNKIERKRSKCCTYYPPYRLQIFFKAYFLVCHILHAIVNSFLFLFFICLLSYCTVKENESSTSSSADNPWG